MTDKECYELVKERFPNAIGKDCDVTAIVWQALETKKNKEEFRQKVLKILDDNAKDRPDLYDMVLYL